MGLKWWREGGRLDDDNNIVSRFFFSNARAVFAQSLTHGPWSPPKEESEQRLRSLGEQGQVSHTGETDRRR